MPAFSERRAKQIDHGLRVLHGKAAFSRPFGLSFKDASEIFVRPEHRALLEQAKGVFDVSGHGGFRYTIGSSYLVFMANGGHPESFPFPKYMGKEIVCAEDNDALRRLEEWGTAQARIARDYALSRWVFKHLDKLCSNPKQLAYLWPVVAHACKHGDDKTKALAGELADVSCPPSLPGLPPPVRAAIRHTIGVITRTELLGPFEATEHSQIGARLRTVGWFSSPLGDQIFHEDPFYPPIGA